MGGKRANAGRKPLVETPAHLSNAEKDRRKDNLRGLQTIKKLKCPAYLTDEAKKEWRRTMRLYSAMDATILCDLDVSALVMYCEAWAIYKEAQSKWAQLKSVVSTNPAAQSVIDKTFDIMNKQSAVVCRLAEQLCLTPVGRVRMGMGNSSKRAGEGLVRFLNGGDENDES